MTFQFLLRQYFILFEENEIFGTDCLLFSYEKHLSKDAEISLDDTLLQTKLVPNIQCKNCAGCTYTTNERYSIFQIPQFVFVTVKNNWKTNTANTTKKKLTITDNYQKYAEEQIYIKCDLKQYCFTYRLFCFIVVTKDERALVVKSMPGGQYAVYNNDKKLYEIHADYQFDDFLAASGTNIVLCYNTADNLEPNPEFTQTRLEMHDWVVNSDWDQTTMTGKFEKYVHKLVNPLKIGPYQLQSSTIRHVLETTHELDDEQLNAHLYVTTTLANGVLLFDSIVFAKYYRRGFETSTEILHQQWFHSNIVLVPVHHLHHWFLFIIDIRKKFIILFDSIPTEASSHVPYQKAIVQLLVIHHFYTKKQNINFNEWKIINNFDNWYQDDSSSCGIHCALFARSYITTTKYPRINCTTIKAARLEFALNLLEYKTR